MSKVVEALVWSFAGFVGGFCLCWVLMRSAYANAREGSVVSRREFRIELVRAVIGLMLLIMVVLSGVSYYHTTTCQTSYNASVAVALQDRSQAQGEQSRAQIELLQASISGDQVAALRETREYIAATAELERVRQQSPIPDQPNCGGL